MRWVFCQRPETVKPERLYEYITLRRERFCVHAMCRVVKVSESGYYRSLQSLASQNRGSCFWSKYERFIKKTRTMITTVLAEFFWRLLIAVSR